MHYKINTKEIKEIIGNSLSTLDIDKKSTPDVFSLKDIDTITLKDIKSYNEKNATPSFLNAGILAKTIQYNEKKQTEPIQIVESDGKYKLKNWKSLGQYLGMLLLGSKEVIIESETPLLFSNIEAIDYSTQQDKHIQSILSWEIPANLKADSWDDPEFALKELKNTYRDDCKDAIKKIPDHLLKNKEFLNKFLELYEYAYLYDYMGSNKINDDLYLETICENPNAFLIQLKSNLGDQLSTIGKKIADYCQLHNIKKHPTSEFHNLDLLLNQKDKLTDYEQTSLKTVRYLNEKLFSNPSKIITLINSVKKNGSKLDFDSIYELVSYAPIDVQMKEEVIKAVKIAHANSGRDYYRKSVVSLIPPEYFSDKSKTISFLKELIYTDDENTRSMFPDYICSIFKDDSESICKLVDMAYEAKGLNFAENVLSKLKENATDKVLADREFFKRLVKVDSYTFKNYEYDKKVKSIYKDYITKDKEMISYLCENGSPKTLSTLPGEFLKQVENKTLKEKLIHENYHLLDSDSPVSDWRYDIELLTSAGRNISNLNLKKSELTEIIKSNKDAIAIIEVDPEMYYKLPASIKKDKDVSLVAVQNLWKNIREIDCSLLLDKKFSLELIRTNAEFVKEIPNSFFYDEEFMLEVFKAIDEGVIGRSAIKDFPQDVSKCIEAFGVKENFESFGKKFFGNQRLTNSLSVKEDSKINKKIKI